MTLDEPLPLGHQSAPFKSKWSLLSSLVPVQRAAFLVLLSRSFSECQDAKNPLELTQWFEVHRAFMYIAPILSSASNPNNPTGCDLTDEEAGPAESSGLPSISQR